MIENFKVAIKFLWLLMCATIIVMAFLLSWLAVFAGVQMAFTGTPSGLFITLIGIAGVLMNYNLLRNTFTVSRYKP